MIAQDFIIYVLVVWLLLILSFFIIWLKYQKLKNYHIEYKKEIIQKTRELKEEKVDVVKKAQVVNYNNFAKLLNQILENNIILSKKDLEANKLHYLVIGEDKNLTELFIRKYKNVNGKATSVKINKLNFNGVKEIEKELETYVKKGSSWS